MQGKDKSKAPNLQKWARRLSLRERDNWTKTVRRHSSHAGREKPSCKDGGKREQLPSRTEVTSV